MTFIELKKDETKKEVGEKSDDGPVTVVFKMDLHCVGCAEKVKGSIRKFKGVERVKINIAENKLTVIGKVEPMRIKEQIESSNTKKKVKVEILSPLPKEEEKKDHKKASSIKSPEKKTNGDEKPKEPQSCTVVLKISPHCDCHGCINEIKRIKSKINGVESVVPESGKDLVTLKGTMNMKELITYLQKKVKRKVEVVPPEEDNKDDVKDGKKEKGKQEGNKKIKTGNL